ncbi:MAG: hypothetical protein ABI723_14815 [Bacteroidia bacterium]
MKNVLGFGAVFGLTSVVKGSSKVEQKEKIKMLTPDGRLIEIDQSQIENEVTVKRASNEEVLKWMKSQQK